MKEPDSGYSQGVDHDCNINPYFTVNKLISGRTKSGTGIVGNGEPTVDLRGEKSLVIADMCEMSHLQLWLQFPFVPTRTL